MLAMVSVATRRRWSEVALLAVPNVASVAVFEGLSQTDPLPWYVLVGFGAVLYAAMVGAGMYIGARRDLVATLRWRAETAEGAQQARVEQAQVAERNRIAREMHDVLAHRISVVTMYAGALSARDDLTDAERRDAAQVIEESSRGRADRPS
jgi:signal transduction histidine kinase